MKETKDKIKEMIEKLVSQSTYTLHSIILFGSRARGDFDEHSDWDVLVILEEELNIQEKRKTAKAIRTALADLYIDCDVIIKSKNELQYYKDFIGSVTREALKEGITL